MKALRLIAAWLILLAGNAHAQSAVANDLAGQLFEKIAAPQAEPLVNQLIEDGIRQGGIQPAAVEIYREFGLQVMRSPQFKQAYVDLYVKVFTEKELQSIVDLSSHPGFLVFVLKSQQLQSLANPAFISLFNKARPELIRRLRKAGFAP